MNTSKISTNKGVNVLLCTLLKHNFPKLHNLEISVFMCTYQFPKQRLDIRKVIFRLLLFTVSNDSIIKFDLVIYTCIPIQYHLHFFHHLEHRAFLL